VKQAPEDLLDQVSRFEKAGAKVATGGKAFALYATT
jgi:hypothetical protein